MGFLALTSSQPGWVLAAVILKRVIVELAGDFIAR